jgi:solute carrier family 30 (zinc transporter), member 5/7
VDDRLKSSMEGSAIDETGMAVQTPGISRIARAYLKTILSNPESRKIFYFLVLNLSYMGVQVVYGIITNSLGLISDGKEHNDLRNVVVNEIS